MAVIVMIVVVAVVELMSQRSAAAPARIHRERDFGVGYGNSSGYASNRTYSTPQNNYFRCR